MQLFEGHEGHILSLAYSPDGRYLASASSDRTVRVWNCLTGKVTLTLNEHEDMSSAVAFSSTGAHILTGGHDGHLHLWNLEEGTVAGSLIQGTEKISDVAFSADGMLFAVAKYSGNVTLYMDTSPVGKELDVLDVGSDSAFTVAFSPDSQMLAVGGAFPYVALYLAAGSKGVERPFTRFHHGDSMGCRDLSFSPDSAQLALALGRGAEIWTIGNRRSHLQLTGHDEAVSCIEFSPDGHTILTASWDGSVRAWNAHDGMERAAFNWGLGSIFALAIAPDGMTAAVGGQSSHVLVHDLPDELLL